MKSKNKLKNFKKKLKAKNIEYETPRSSNKFISIKYTEIIIEYKEEELYIKESILDKGKMIENFPEILEFIANQQKVQKYLDEFGESSRSAKPKMSIALSFVWGIISGVIAYLTSDKSTILTGLTLGGSIGITFVMNMMFDKTGYYKYWSKTSKKSWYTILLICILIILLIPLLKPLFDVIESSSNFKYFSNFILAFLDILSVASFTTLFCVGLLRLLSDRIYFIIEPHIIDKQEKRIGKKYYNSHEYFLPKSLIKNKNLSLHSIVTYFMILEYIDNIMEEKNEYNQDILKIHLPSSIIKKTLSISNAELNKIKDELITYNFIEEKVDESSQVYIKVNEFR